MKHQTLLNIGTAIVLGTAFAYLLVEALSK